VDIFRARGAGKVQWMWCINAEPKPYAVYNWIINSYPGDSYVDIVATDVYNHPDLGIPAWKSFRYTLAESYYYLTRYFPNKPFYICEVACRERDPSELAGSQTKADWTCQMSRDLQSFFSKTQALIFFSTVKEHDWRLNSSPVSLQAAEDCIWNNGFFQQTISVSGVKNIASLQVYPNPFIQELTIEANGLPEVGDYQLTIYNTAGENVYNYAGLKQGGRVRLSPRLPNGIYLMEVKNSGFAQKFKIVKTGA
jgi:hypothetical protein